MCVIFMQLLRSTGHSRLVSKTVLYSHNGQVNAIEIKGLLHLNLGLIRTRVLATNRQKVLLA